MAQDKGKQFQVIYDYSDAPTLKRFALSNKRFRLAMGPFGCLSNDTEYLSRCGWSRIDDYSGGEIAEFNLDTSRLEFRTPLEYVKLPCESFLHLKNRYGLDQLLSDEHTVLFNTRFKPDQWRTISALELSEAHNRLKDGWSGRIPTTFKAPASSVGVALADDEIRLMVAVSADGHFPNKADGVKPETCHIAVRKERKKMRLRSLLDRCGIEWIERNYPARPTETVFVFDAPERNKLLWKYFEASDSQLAVIADEFVHWDGCVDCYGGRIYSTTVRENADFIQCVLAMTGVRATIAQVDYKNEKWEKGYRVYANTGTTMLSLRQAPKVGRVASEDGYKYCFRTSTGFLVARRNGKIFVTGNSGKSSACVMEIIRRANNQIPAPDGIRRSRWGIVRNCYDDQTEILTEKKGWQLFRDLTADDRVAALKEGKVVYMKPDGVAVHPYNGEMIGFEGESIDFRVTPDHLMYVSRRRTRKKIWGEFEEASAESIFGSQLVRVKRDAEWLDGNDHGFSESIFELLGLWFAEGSYGCYKNKKRVTITQCKPDGVEYVRGVIREAGLEFAEWKRADGGINFVLRDMSEAGMFISDIAAGCGKAHEKAIPLVVKNSTRKCLRALIRGIIFGDGCTFKGTTRVQLSSRQLVDDLQEIGLKAGYVVNAYKSADNTGRKIEYKGNVGHTNHPTYSATFLVEKKYSPVLKTDRKAMKRLRGWYKEDYSGFVYCVEMEKVPVYVRRKGKAFWCYRTYNQLRDTTIKTFMDWFPEKYFGNYKVSTHDYLITAFPGVHLEVMFRALDRPDQVSNLLSLELTGAWFNEAREIPQTIIEAMDGRIGRYPSRRDGGPGWHGIIMDTNPPDEGSYLYNMAEVVKPANWDVFKQPSGLSIHAENTKYLTPGYYQNLAMGKDEMYIRVYIHGQYGFTVAGKPVFISFKDNVHVANHVMQPIKGLPILTGWDFGLNPSVVLAQITPAGQLRILDELSSNGMGLKQFCLHQFFPLLQQKYFGYHIMGYGDPAGISRTPTDESTCFEILQGHEVGLRDVVPASSNVLQSRIGAVEHFLNSMYGGEPNFVLSPNCILLRKALNGMYHYEREKGGQEFRSVPAKNYYSHISDALQYLCMYIMDDKERAKRRMLIEAEIRKMATMRGNGPACGVVGY